ncbi:MAG: aldo/keto reductase [Verrucomicrobiota bacterium]
MHDHLENETSRREFLRASVAGLVGATLVPTLVRSAEAPSSAGTMPMRALGKTGEKVSVLGLGGFHIGVGSLSDNESVRLIQEAIDNGVTFLDNAWCYHDGRSETRVGLALPGRRDRVFLMTKNHGREKNVAMQHLEDSLRRFKTDRIDLWMFHECVYEQDPDRIFASGGGIEAAVLAKQQGKVRYVGFTGHKYPWIHLKMLAYEYPWDAVLMPLNILDGSFQSFEKWVLPVLLKRGIAPLAMKSRASGDILRAGIATPEECWRYVAALPVATIVSGIDSIDILKKNLDLARNLQPMTDEEKVAVLKRTRDVALSGKLERFKTSNAFDGPVGRKLYGV